MPSSPAMQHIEAVEFSNIVLHISPRMSMAVLSMLIAYKNIARYNINPTKCKLELCPFNISILTKLRKIITT